MTIADEALIFAFHAHEGQTRRYSGEPYICHPIRVADELRRNGYTDQGLLAAAFLHDVLDRLEDAARDPNQPGIFFWNAEDER
jgi:(p)ppGpp synthase/HD superfamily hydrolase